MSKTCSEQVAKTQMLTAGMKKNIDKIRNKGLDEDFIGRLKSGTDQLSAFNEECDRMKEELRIKTKQLNIKSLEVKTQVKEAKKIIKRDFEKGTWSEFGIADSK